MGGRLPPADSHSVGPEDALRDEGVVWGEDAVQVEELLKQLLAASLQPSIYSQCTWAMPCASTAGLWV